MNLAGNVEDTRHISTQGIGVFSGGVRERTYRSIFVSFCFIFQFSIFGLLAQSLLNAQNISGLLGALQTIQKYKYFSGLDPLELLISSFAPHMPF